MPTTTIGYQVITSRSINSQEIEVIVMISLTEDEEKLLDNDGFLKCEKGGQIFIINKNNIICYGPIDFTTNSDDYCVIQDMKFLDHLMAQGICVPSNYDYKEHCSYSDLRKARYYDSTNPAVVTQYIHGRLGKPHSCCIFKEKINGKRKI